ncbi:MAG: cation-binding protein [Chlorobiales bacterium]|nr:cation-binding protein [Chlorobiales bacterium]
MNATGVLKREHRIIERFMDTFERMVDLLEKKDSDIDYKPFLEAAEFVKGFADDYHHKKEEDILFKVMVQNGMSEQAGPIAVMKYEHQQGRNFTMAIRQAAEKGDAGDLSVKNSLIANARSYILLLREHISKEDNVLFPMAERIIPLAQHDSVDRQFAHVDDEVIGQEARRQIPCNFR